MPERKSVLAGLLGLAAAVGLGGYVSGMGGKPSQTPPTLAVVTMNYTKGAIDGYLWINTDSKVHMTMTMQDESKVTYIPYVGTGTATLTGSYSTIFSNGHSVVAQACNQPILNNREYFKVSVKTFKDGSQKTVCE